MTQPIRISFESDRYEQWMSPYEREAIQRTLDYYPWAVWPTHIRVEQPISISQPRFDMAVLMDQSPPVNTSRDEWPYISIAPRLISDPDDIDSHDLLGYFGPSFFRTLHHEMGHLVDRFLSFDSLHNARDLETRSWSLHSHFTQAALEWADPRARIGYRFEGFAELHARCFLRPSQVFRECPKGFATLRTWLKKVWQPLTGTFLPPHPEWMLGETVLQRYDEPGQPYTTVPDDLWSDSPIRRRTRGAWETFKAAGWERGMLWKAPGVGNMIADGGWVQGVYTPDYRPDRLRPYEASPDISLSPGDYLYGVKAFDPIKLGFDFYAELDDD